MRLRMRGAALLVLLAGCGDSREARLAAERRAAGPLLDEYESRSREAFRRLPPCPRGAALAGSVEAFGGIRLPASFRRDTARTSYMHGGARYHSGDTIAEVVFGHWGSSSFTGRYDRPWKLPAGCKARFERHVYLVTGHARGGRYHASAVQLSDTSRVYGEVLLGVDAPRPVQAFLLRLLATTEAPLDGSPRR